MDKISYVIRLWWLYDSIEVIYTHHGIQTRTIEIWRRDA